MSKKAEDAEAVGETFFHKLGIPLLGPYAMREAIELNRDTGNTVCIVGEAGIGKTHITRQVAAGRKPRKPFTWRNVRWETSVPLIPFYLAHLQPEDLSVPYPSRAKQDGLIARAVQLQQLVAFMRSLRIDDAGQHEANEQTAQVLEQQIVEISKMVATLDERSKKNGTMEFLINKELFDLPPEGILFFDEYNRADRGVIKSFFTLIEDGAVHGVRLIHPGIQIVAAMNPSDGQYSVNEAEKDPAIKRRLCFIAMTTNFASWLAYARGKFHDLVVDFVEADNTALYDTKLRAAGKVFPCPATWEKVSKLLVAADTAQIPYTAEGLRACVCGHIGEAMGRKFADFLEDKSVLIPPSDVLGKYTEKSGVRKKVMKMIADARFDILTELCANVAGLLLASQPNPDNVAAKLALFLGDLPSDTATAFIVQKLRAAGDGVADGPKYMMELSKALSVQPPYNRHIQAITDALAKARREVGKPDPLSA